MCLKLPISALLGHHTPWSRNGRVLAQLLLAARFELMESSHETRKKIPTIRPSEKVVKGSGDGEVATAACRPDCHIR
jgi:hypothetical protein